MRRGEAVRRKEAGVRAISSGPNRGFTLRITRAILRRAPGEAFTSEDLRRSIRAKGHGNAWGAALHNAARAGHIVAAGFRRSTRPESHARVIAVWRRR
jgi:hypothetical protein